MRIVSDKFIWYPFYIILFIVTIFTTGCGDGGTSVDTGNSYATISWEAPSTNTDGTQLTDLAGYKIYYGNSPGIYDNVVDVTNVEISTINNLSPGTYYFAVTAYNEEGNESDYSNEISKTIP